MSFEPKDGSAIDRTRDLEIFRPRAQPAGIGDQADFEFVIRWKEKRTGLGCGGSVIVHRDRSTRWTFRIDAPSELDNYEKQRAYLTPDLSLLDFLRYIADGMTMTFASGAGVFHDSVFQAVISTATLQARNVDVSTFPVLAVDGDLVLSERHVKGMPPPSEED